MPPDGVPVDRHGGRALPHLLVRDSDPRPAVGPKGLHGVPGTDQSPSQLLMDLGSLRMKSKTFLFTRKGCPICNGTGYKGRIGLYEVMPMKEEVKELVLARASTSEIKKEAIRWE